MKTRVVLLLLVAGCQTLVNPVVQPDFIKDVLAAHQQSFSSVDSPAVAWGTMTISNQQTTWFCWYDRKTWQVSFLLDRCEVGPEFEARLATAVEEVEGKGSTVEDSRVIHIRNKARINGIQWISTADCPTTIFFFRSQKFSKEFFDHVVGKLLGSGVVSEMKVAQTF